MVWYVYELINSMGTVEYVGQTVRSKIRFGDHTRTNPGPGRGKFYRRQDISMHIVATYTTRVEALQAEHDLQVYWGLPTDRSKRSQKGSKNGMSKLTEDQVREIKYLLAQKISGAEIGRRFGISKMSIWKIKKGIAWTHVI